MRKGIYKRGIGILLVATLVVSGVACDKDSDSDKEKETGIVKEEEKVNMLPTECTTYEVTDVYVNGIAQDNIKFEYNSNGNLVKKEVYSARSNTIVDVYKYEYDSNGNRIKVIWIDSDETQIFNYEYDSDGKLIREVKENEEGENEIVSEYEYDKEGKLIKEEYYGGFSFSEMNFPEELNDIIENPYNRGGVDALEVEYTYNLEGEVQKKDCSYIMDAWNDVWEWTMEYDDRGNLKKEIWSAVINYMGDTYEWEREYDEAGKLIMDGGVNVRYEYDEKGRIIKKILYVVDEYAEEYYEKVSEWIEFKYE